MRFKFKPSLGACPRTKNLPQTSFLSLRFLFSDKLLVLIVYILNFNSFDSIAQTTIINTTETKKILNLIMDFKESVNESEKKYHNYLSDECKKDDKFIRLLNVRHNLFYFHHKLRDGNNFELMFKRETSFIGKMFYSNREAIKANELIDIKNIKDYVLFIKELLSYYQKITLTNSWENKFNLLLKDKKLFLARASTYHTSGFPKHNNNCYLTSNQFSSRVVQWDSGTEGWFYSFWIRRYKEGNFELTKIMLDWSLDYLTKTNFQEVDSAIKYKDNFLIKLSSKTVKVDEELKQSNLVDRHSICESNTIPSGFSFTRAYHTNEHTFNFNPIIKINWKAKTSEKYTNIDLENIKYQELSMLRKKIDRWFGSTFTYKSSLDCTTNKGYYYLLSSEGIDFVNLKNLEGSVTFGNDGNPSVFYGPGYYGKIIAHEMKKKHAGGGFIMLSQTNFGSSLPIQNDFSFNAVQEDRMMIYTYKDDNKELVVKVKNRHPRKIMTKYKFKHDGVEYIFVKWDSDNEHTFCEYYYNLFKIDKNLKEVVWNNYQCDI